MRLKEGDKVWCRCTHRTRDLYGQVLFWGDKNWRLCIVVDEGMHREENGLLVQEVEGDDIAHVAEGDWKPLQQARKRGYNFWGEKAKVGMHVIVRNGVATRRAFGESGITDNRFYFGRVTEISPNGNPCVDVFGLGEHWFAHADWREEVGNKYHLIPNNMAPFDRDGVAAPAPAPKPPEKYADKAAMCKASLSEGIAKGIPNQVTVCSTYQKGRTRAEFRATICHAFMSKYKELTIQAKYLYPVMLGSTYALSAMRGGPTEEKVRTLISSKDPQDMAYVDYIRFLCEDEVLSQAWVNPELEDVLLSGFECYMDCPQVIAMCAYTAARLHYEYPERLRFWWELVQRGVHPRVALVMQAYVHGYDPAIYFRSEDHGHQVFSSRCITVEGVRNFRDNTLPEMDKRQCAPISGGFVNFNDYFNGDGQRVTNVISDPLNSPQEVKNPLTGKIEVRPVTGKWKMKDLADRITELCKENEL